MAKAKKKSAKEASKTFHDIMNASVKDNPKPQKKNNKIMEEIKIPLNDGSTALINEIPPGKDGMKRYLIESDNASFDAFTYTPTGRTKDGDGITASQKSVITQ